MQLWLKRNFALLYVVVIALSLAAGMALAFFLLPTPLVSIPATGVATTVLMLGMYPKARDAITKLNNGSREANNEQR